MRWKEAAGIQPKKRPKTTAHRQKARDAATQQQAKKIFCQNVFTKTRTSTSRMAGTTYLFWPLQDSAPKKEPFPDRLLRSRESHLQFEIHCRLLLFNKTFFDTRLKHGRFTFPFAGCRDASERTSGDPLEDGGKCFQSPACKQRSIGFREPNGRTQ